MGNEIYALLDGISLRRASLVFQRDDLIDEASKLFTDIPSIQEALAEVFHKRNRIGDTYIEPFQALLLHGKTPWIKHPCFEHVQLEPPMYEVGRPLLLKVLRSGNKERLRELLETLLLQFYKRTLHHRLSNGI